MSYIVPIFKPTSVRLAIEANLGPEEAKYLVVAIANRLEIWTLKGPPEGKWLQRVYSQTIFGVITILQKIRPKEWPYEVLFVGTAQKYYFTAHWDSANSRLVKRQTLRDSGSTYMRDNQSMDKCIVDPTGKFLVLHVWEGVLKILRVHPMRKGAPGDLDELEQVRITELQVRSSIFLHSETGHPKIAFLYQGQPDIPDSQLAVYRLTADDKHTKSSRFDPAREREISIRNLEPGATMLIPVEHKEEEKRHNVRNPQLAKAHLGGLIVVGETSLVYVDSRSKCTVESPLDEACIFVAWTRRSACRYILADDFGYLYILTIDAEAPSYEVRGMTARRIGKQRTSRASCLVSLGDGYLYLGSHHGSAKLLRVGRDTSNDSWDFEEVQSMPNHAPVLDFTLMDMGARNGPSQLTKEFASGQARLVLGCGAWEDGVLNSIRSGVSLEDIGILAVVKNVWGLFPFHFTNPTVDCLVVSLPAQTRVFAFHSDGVIEEVSSFHSLVTKSTTLLINDYPTAVLQVTPHMVLLMDKKSGRVTASWDPPTGRTITLASANNKWLVLSVDGKSIVSFNLEGHARLRLTREISVDETELACLHVSPSMEDVAVIASWSGDLSLVDPGKLSGASHSLHESQKPTSVVRDLALIQILPNTMRLFASMSDGLIISFTVSPNDLSCHSRSTISLSTLNSRFHLIRNNTAAEAEHAIYNILATSEHSTLIYGEEGRILYSAVTEEDVLHAAPFSVGQYQGAVAFVTKSALKLCNIEPERRTHVMGVPMGEVVRRVAYAPAARAFGLGCIRRELQGSEEVVTSSFRLVDEAIFDTVGKPLRLGDTAYSEVVESVIKAEFPDSYGNMVERFVVGTSLQERPDHFHHSNFNGRILVIGIDSERNPYLIASAKSKGSCRCLAMMGDKIVAGLTKVIALYSYQEHTTVHGELTQLAAHRAVTTPTDLTVHENTIAVADLTKSCVLIDCTIQADGEVQLVERARDEFTGWATSVAYAGNNSWLMSYADGTLRILRDCNSANTAGGNRPLAREGYLHLGEMINQIRSVFVETRPGAIMTPKAFCGTVEGGIYLYGMIAHKFRSFFMALQQRLGKHLSENSLSGMSFNAARSEGSETGPVNFIDGELIERFLELDEDTQQSLIRRLGISLEDTKDMIEELRRQH